MSPSTPEEALAEARRRAAAARAAGTYDDAEAVAGLGRTLPYEGIDKLYDWAFIEPDRDQVASTRRLGAPITAVKRGLMRLLRQYHWQMEGEQTRFNVHLLSYIARLEGRVSELEEHRGKERSS